MDSTSSAIVGSASVLAQAQVQQQVAVSILKTALDVQANGALALIQALPKPASAGSTSLGTLIDVYA